MARKERNTQAAIDHVIGITAESYRKMEKERAEANLKAAKDLEEKRLKAGYQWITNGKTHKLIKPVNNG